MSGIITKQNAKDKAFISVKNKTIVNESTKQALNTINKAFPLKAPTQNVTPQSS